MNKLNDEKALPMQGSCLCGVVRFQLDIYKLRIYQCHCNLCRKQTGTASSCGSVVAEEKFLWLAGADAISTWQKSTGMSSHFCSVCGSSVPNLFRGKPYYWVPAGLMNSESIETLANIFVGEKATWSNVDSCINACEGKPDVDALIRLLTGDATA